MKNQEFIGVDIGGTKFSMGRVKNGAIVTKSYQEISRTASKEETLKMLTDNLSTLLTPGVEGIGVGVPGIVDQETGVIYDIQNIPAWKEVPLQEYLEKRYKLPVAINNDANCFALGEKVYGKGQAFQNFVGLSIGTGLGMGVIINNQLYSGVMSGAGEIGMLPYKEGIIEEYAGSFFFQREYQQSAKELNDKAMEGDAMALKAYREFGGHLGEAIKIILFMYAPEAIIIGGSISKAYPFYKEALKVSLDTFNYPKQIEGLKLLISGNAEMPILGAASLCTETH